jgi:hypothetical protein
MAQLFGLASFTQLVIVCRFLSGLSILERLARINAMRARLILLVLLAGCTQADLRQGSIPKDPPLTAERIRNAQRIVVSGGDGFLGHYSGSRWVLEASGKCFGETYSGCDAGYHFKVTKTYDLPPETFLEVQRVLLQSKLWTLKQGEQSFVFESSYGLSVECDAAKHETYWGQGMPEPCQVVLDFMAKLPERGKETSVTDSRQESPRP